MKKTESTFNPSPKIVFIGNDTGRTGAPIILLEVARHLHRLGWKCIFVFERDGILTDQYEQIGKCYFWFRNLDAISSKSLRWIAKFGFNLGLRLLDRNLIKQKIKRFNPDLFYANTGVSGYLLKELKSATIPSVMHVHEMKGILKNYCGYKFTQGIRYTDKFIAVNNLIKKTLISEYKIPSHKIEVIPAFMPYDSTSSNYENKKSNQFIVGSAGMPSFRKGTDLFMKVAAHTKKICDNRIIFRWVGFNTKDSSNQEYMHLIQELDISDIMELIPHTPTPLIQFAEFDVFFLSSREDPNPLVVLESGKLGKPVLCFNGSGATDEIVEAGGGTMVTMESIEEMSLAIVQYSKNPNLLAQHSQRIENIISETYSKQHILAKITESVKNSTLK